MQRVRANVAAWSAEIEGEGLDAIVINASGCGTMVKDYGFLLRTEDEPWRSRAAKVAALTLDISQFLTLDFDFLDNPQGRVRIDVVQPHSRYVQRDVFRQYSPDIQLLY